MQIELNGEPHQLPEEATASALVDQLQLQGKRIAMEVNGEVVSRSTYADYRFCENDRVELVHAIGGG